MYDKYGNYDSTAVFIDSIGKSLSGILGGYVEGKIENNRNRRTLQAYNRDMPEEDLNFYSGIDPRVMPGLLNKLEANKKREVELTSLNNLASKFGISETEMEGMNAQERKTYINYKAEKADARNTSIEAQKELGGSINPNLTLNQNLAIKVEKERERKSDEAQRSKVSKKLVEEGYSQNQAEKLSKQIGEPDYETIKNGKIPQGLTPILRSAFVRRKSYLNGELADKDLDKYLEGKPEVLESFVKGDRMTLKRDDPQKEFILEQARIRLEQSENFRKLSKEEKTKKLTKLGKQWLKVLGFTFKIPKKVKKDSTPRLNKVPKIKGYPFFSPGLI